MSGVIDFVRKSLFYLKINIYYGTFSLEVYINLINFHNNLNEDTYILRKETTDNTYRWNYYS